MESDSRRDIESLIIYKDKEEGKKDRRDKDNIKQGKSM